jgi:hypothetical protein
VQTLPSTGSAKRLVVNSAKDDGARAWKLLVAEYQGKDMLRVNNLKAAMMSLRCAEGADPMEFMLRMEELAAEIKEADSDRMNEGELVALILRGLPASYEQFETLVSMDEKLPIEVLRTRLRAFSNNRRFKQLESSFAPAADAFVVVNSHRQQLL